MVSIHLWGKSDSPSARLSHILPRGKLPSGVNSMHIKIIQSENCIHSGVAILGVLNLGGLPKFHTYELGNFLFIVSQKK